jgi:thiamine kinase-like enzyme
VTPDASALEALIAAIPALAGRWSIEPLSGLTNRSFRLSRDDTALVLRLPGTGSGEVVDRQDEAHNHALAAALGIAPPLLHSEPTGLLVTRYLAGARSLSLSVADEPGVLDAVGDLLRRLHHSGACFRGARDPFDNLDRYLALAGEAGDPELHHLRRAAEPARQALAAAMEPSVPSHIDPAPANILRLAERLTLIDWEYSAMAEPAWDLADFAAEAGLGPDAAARLLEAYGRAASGRELARIALWRMTLDLLAAAWAQLLLISAPAADLAAVLDERRARADEVLGGRGYGLLLEAVTR